MNKNKITNDPFKFHFLIKIKKKQNKQEPNKKKNRKEQKVELYINPNIPLQFKHSKKH